MLFFFGFETWSIVVTAADGLEEAQLVQAHDDVIGLYEQYACLEQQQQLDASGVDNMSEDKSDATRVLRGSSRTIELG